jgi:hypothetical protein
MKIKKYWLYIAAFILLLLLNGLFYWGFQDNYFFCDDFHWLGRAVLVQDSPGEIFKIEGRDFNPVFLLTLGILVKFAGISPPMLRFISLLVFSALAWMFFYLLSRYFKVHPLLAFCAALLFSLSVFVSEVVLNLSALVYSLSLLLFLVGLKLYLDKKQWLFVLFFLLAFFTKETILLAAIPLFFYEKKRNHRIFLAASTGIMVVLRIVLQLGAVTGSYTDFLSLGNYFYKLYFILLRAMNLSPYTLPLPVGILVILLLLVVSLYFLKLERDFSFFLLFLVIFSLFFSLFPKLTSRYFLFPTFAFWGMAALLAHHFQQKKEALKYALVPLVLIGMLFNYSLIRREIEDYKILGDFSNRFIQREATLVKNQLNSRPGVQDFTFYKGDNRQLAAVYLLVNQRENLPKLLPFREHSIGGVIEPKHLVPMVLFPEHIARWVPLEETVYYFKGQIIYRSRNRFPKSAGK